MRSFPATPTACPICRVQAVGRPSNPRVQKWLTKLPKPVAILASNDSPGRDLADICRLLGLRVPEDVAIIGVDNDDLECELASPPLSSVAIPSLQIGCEAARLLDRLMAGEPPPAAPIFLPPIGVVTRPSTDILMIEDRDVAAALSFIRLHAGEEINVKAVSQAVAVGLRHAGGQVPRAVATHGFRGDPPVACIEKAKELLSGTNVPMPAVAKGSGFVSAQRFATVFRTVTGWRPRRIVASLAVASPPLT